MGRSKTLVVLLAFSLLVSLALAPCRADEIVAEDDVDDDVSDVADIADASPSGALNHFFPTNALCIFLVVIPPSESRPRLAMPIFSGVVRALLGASRRFLWSSEMHRMLSCKSDCEEKNKECNEEYSEFKKAKQATLLASGCEKMIKVL
ncbi:unnamed protein product [Closterium sp. NIES-64]|nr:unnamed protein product [Closterium sp. NIES-64]